MIKFSSESSPERLGIPCDALQDSTSNHKIDISNRHDERICCRLEFHTRWAQAVWERNRAGAVRKLSLKVFERPRCSSDKNAAAARGDWSRTSGICHCPGELPTEKSRRRRSADDHTEPSAGLGGTLVRTCCTTPHHAFGIRCFPVPSGLKSCGLLSAESLTLSWPMRVLPLAAGVKVTLIRCHLPLASRLVPQVVAETTKSPLVEVEIAFSNCETARWSV